MSRPEDDFIRPRRTLAEVHGPGPADAQPASRADLSHSSNRHAEVLRKGGRGVAHQLDRQHRILLGSGVFVSAARRSDATRVRTKLATYLTMRTVLHDEAVWYREADAVS